MKIACNNSKTDQTGEKLSPKNIHTNPHEPTMCPFLSSGAWMNMSPEHSMESEKSFLEVLQTGVVRILVGFSQTGRKKLKKLSILNMPILMGSEKVLQHMPHQTPLNQWHLFPLQQKEVLWERFLMFIGNLVKKKTSVLENCGVSLLIVV